MPRAVPRPPRPTLASAPHDAAVRGVLVATPAELGHVIRWVRGERQVTLLQAAAGLGVSPNVLRGLEHADRDVGVSTALEILMGLGLDVVLVPRNPDLRLKAPPVARPVERHG